ncbi:hypothetical protein [Parapedobacter tibetensis]|uniref:hypothetical protein n=1 Tax=Parapedobacter tibetensis TaxID=2972951 RepID=UPI00214DA3AF|nr:hypothetical protein [Parapedobacter tibetensis]
MKVLLEVKDNKFAALMEVLKDFSFVNAEALSESDIELFNEIKEIKTAYKNATSVKAGKLKTRPIEDLMNEV